MLTSLYVELPPSSIIIDREQRQRRQIDVTDLLDSVRQRGIINPILITQERKLIAGERRLTAAIAVGLSVVPCRYAAEGILSVEEQELELEENVKRRDLPWRDEVLAIARLHALYQQREPTWTQEQTATALCLTAGPVAKALRVAQEISDPRLAQVTGLEAAYNMLARRDQRVAADVLSDIVEAGIKVTAPAPATTTTTAEAAPAPAVPKIIPAEQSILHESFLDWAPKYSGRPFNFVHCDFPYGINLFAGKWSGRATTQTYDDSSETYFNLIKCLCGNIDRLMSASSHLMFWFSLEWHYETLEAFREHAPSLTFQTFPLIWHKSDNVGIMPDPKRYGRRTYETALVASREDRIVNKPVAISYAAPTDRDVHGSTKPEPMLRHFFQMFVDEHTRMLDPTCGSASALRAAESMGAREVLGLERDEENCKNARSELRKFRLLRSANK